MSSHPKVKYVIEQMMKQDITTSFPVMSKEGLIGILEFALHRVKSPMGTIDESSFDDVEQRIEAQAFACIGTLCVWLDARFEVRYPVDDDTVEKWDG